MAASDSLASGMEQSEGGPIGRAGYEPRMQSRPSAFLSRWRALPLGLPLLLYLALPTRGFYWDGVAFAIDIEKRRPAASLVHPNHLIYSLWGAWIYKLTGLAGIHARALFILQAANSVLAGLCVILFYSSLRLKRVPDALSVPAALIFGFSATWWKFATDANAYVPSIFFLLCAYVLIERRKSTALAGFAHAGAMLFHELAILFLPVALLRLRKSPRMMLTYVATALVPVAAAYAVAYSSVSNTGLFAWMTAHSPDSGFSFHPLTALGFSIRGTLRLFFGGKLGDFAHDGISRAGLLVLPIAVVLFLVAVWRAVRRGARISWPPLHLVAWAGVYAAFLFVWMPQNTFYRLFYLPALIAILAVMLRDTPATRTALWLFVPVLMTWNFCFDIYPQSQPGFNKPLSFALAQRNTWGPGTPIVFHRFHPDLWTISYFSQQAVWIGLERADAGELERDLNYARSQNKALWLEAAAYDMIAADPNGRRWLALHERPGEQLDVKDEKHDFRFYCVR